MEMDSDYDDIDGFLNQEDEYHDSLTMNSVIKKNGNTMRVGTDFVNTSYNITVEMNGKIVRSIQYNKVSKYVFDNVVSDLKREYPSSKGYTVRSNI